MLFGTGTQRGLLKITPAGSLGPKLFASLNPGGFFRASPFQTALTQLYLNSVSYTHLRAHETQEVISYAVFCLKKKFFFNDTATTEIYTTSQSSAASDVYKRQVTESKETG